MRIDRLFPVVLELSQTATAVILAVLLLRALLHRFFPSAARRQTVILWLSVAFALLCPLKLSTDRALYAPMRATPTELALPPAVTETVSTADAVVAAYRAVGDTLNGGIDVVRIPTDPALSYVLPAFHDQVWLLFFGRIWLPVCALILLAALCSFLRLKHTLAASLPLDADVCLSDGIDTAFVIGCIRPKIYLPSALSEEDRPILVTHERTHIAYRDPALKLFAFILCALYWFNPLVWLAFVCFSRDLELRCDEKTIATLTASHGHDMTADYADALLRLSPKTRPSVFSPAVGFAEHSTKARIVHVLHAPVTKPTTGVVSILLCAVMITACTLTGDDLIRASGVESVTVGDVTVEPSHGDALVALINESTRTVNHSDDRMDAAHSYDRTVVIRESSDRSFVLCNHYAEEEPDGFRSVLFCRAADGTVLYSYLLDDAFDRAFSDWLYGDISVSVTHGGETTGTAPLAVPRTDAFDYADVPTLYVTTDAVVTFRGALDDTVSVSEDHYAQIGRTNTQIQKQTLTLTAENGVYTFTAAHRNPTVPEEAIYYIGGAETRYLFRIAFMPQTAAETDEYRRMLAMQTAQTLLLSLSPDTVTEATFWTTADDHVTKETLPLTEEDLLPLYRMLRSVSRDDIVLSPMMLYGNPDIIELVTDRGTVTVYYLDIETVQIYTEQTGMFLVHDDGVLSQFNRLWARKE